MGIVKFTGKQFIVFPTFAETGQQPGGLSMKCRLTQTLANSGTLPDGKDGEVYWDTDLIGFGLRVRRSGARVIRSWLVTYRHHGRQRRPSISADTVSLPDARRWAKKILERVELGEDPQADKKAESERNERTLKWVAKLFAAEKDAAAARGEIKRRTADAKHHYLLGRRPDPKGNRKGGKGHVDSWLKPLHNVPIHQISIGDISACLAAAEKNSGKGSAIALRSVTSELFSWAMREGYAAQNPVVNARQVKPVKPRDRVLTPSELVAIWKNLADDDYAKVVKMLILTGSRRSEVGGMRWSEIDLDEGTWTLPKERSKNGLAHTLPLVPMLREIIAAVPKRDGLRGGDVLFGYGPLGFQDFHNGRRELDERISLPPWRLHDVRRSAATGMANIGIAPHIIETILNHQSGHKAGPAGVYNRSIYANDVRDALLRWSNYLADLLEDRAPKVVAFPERASGTQ
jgi:integrase